MSETSATEKAIPTLYDWLGGIEPLNRLTVRFYEHVKADALLAPIFAHMGPEHGGHPHMIRQHLNRHLTQDQRRRWVTLLLETADELRLPDDPEFRSALVGYLEWGSRLAVINSQPGVKAEENAPMPKWGWGEVKGPYTG